MKLNYLYQVEIFWNFASMGIFAYALTKGAFNLILLVNFFKGDWAD
jgi:hypothetical protein